MTILEFLVLLLVAGLSGAAGQALAGYGRGGCLASIALGFVGALLGQWIANLLGVSEILAVRIGGETFPVVWSVMGAAILVAILGLFTRGRR
jgi:uncharacterized membrane protein YeaQ/YmgE (transglycosylase-associated protein family)